MANKDMRYNLNTLPTWEPMAIVPEGKVADPPEGKVYWSGATHMPTPPAIGDRVYVSMNGFGPGVVRGYFVEYGWLGVYVKCDAPPAWYLKQIAEDPGPRLGNKERVPMLFGSEIRPLDASHVAPQIVSTQEVE